MTHSSEPTTVSGPKVSELNSHAGFVVKWSKQLEWNWDNEDKDAWRERESLMSNRGWREDFLLDDVSHTPPAQYSKGELKGYVIACRFS